MELADARALWDPEPGWLNTASYGLPPAPAKLSRGPAVMRCI